MDGAADARASLVVLGECPALPLDTLQAQAHFDDSDRFLLSPAPFGHDLYLVLPRQRGVPALDLIRILRRRAPGAAILALAEDWPARLAPWLDAGADMVLPAPLDAAQLRSALAALARRLPPAAGASPWRLVQAECTLLAPDGTRILLSEAECTLLACLADAPRHRVERHALVQRLWGPAAGEMDNALQALLYRLRRRIDRAWAGGAPVHAVSRVGYEFRAPLRRAGA